MADSGALLLLAGQAFPLLLLLLQALLPVPGVQQTVAWNVALGCWLWLAMSAGMQHVTKQQLAVAKSTHSLSTQHEHTNAAHPVRDD